MDYCSLASYCLNLSPVLRPLQANEGEPQLTSEAGFARSHFSGGLRACAHDILRQDCPRATGNQVYIRVNRTSDARNAAASNEFTFSIVPIAPFRLDLTAWALRRRKQNMVDRSDGATYRRVFIFDDVPVEVAIRQSGPSSTPQLNVILTGARVRPEFRSERKSTRLNSSH